MAKKKKKSTTPVKESDKAFIPRTPLSASKPVALDIPLQDALSLRVVQSSSSSSKRPDSLPQAYLSEHDAIALDVLPDEDVILLACSPEDESTITGVAICRADVMASTRSPSKSEGRRAVITPGSIRVAPSSVTDALFRLDAPGSVAKSTPRKQPDTPATTPAPATPSSTGGDKFSFARGGGGEQLYLSPSTPTTPSLRSTPSKSPLNPLWVVPLESPLGHRISSTLCRQAARVCFKLPQLSQNLEKVEQVLKRIILAHCVGRYVQSNERLRVSFQGKPLELEIDWVDAATLGNDLEQELNRLTIDAGDSDTPSLEESTILKAMGSLSNGNKVYKMTYETGIDFARPEVDLSTPFPGPIQQRVAGLSSVMAEVRSLLLPPLTKPEIFAKGNLKPPRGVLLHGPSGVGKSCLADQIAVELEALVDVQYINCASLQSKTSIVGEAEGWLSRLFQISATAVKGKLLIFDDIHLICPKRGGVSAGSDRLTSTLLALIDGISTTGKSAPSQNVVILAITTNPSLLDSALRRPGRLDTEVEVPIPDEASTRAEILQFQVDSLGFPLPAVSDDDWLALGKLAKGFNGADCRLAVKEALRTAILRKAIPVAVIKSPTEPTEMELSLEDLQTAIRHTKPSAIKSITVEIPRVHWSSIGGMDSVKKELRDAIELPLTHSELFTKLRVPPPRGILLYGPPGCSKTLMARALATEGQMNFLAVKGPELLSKWLGESERALASLFRRARMASPSIIFFDEIDAIASKRGHGDSASSGRLLSQLLTELDGVNHTGSSAGNKKQRVVVVGATNRPDLLDSALTRPGRIDRMIYVGVPDASSRASIFELNLKGKTCGDDIDVQHLARDEVSGGFSGAEVVALCRDAALLALEESEDLTSDVAPKLQMRHLVRAIDSMQRQITPEMLEFYTSYRNVSTSTQ